MTSLLGKLGGLSIGEAPVWWPSNPESLTLGRRVPSRWALIAMTDHGKHPDLSRAVGFVQLGS